MDNYCFSFVSVILNCPYITFHSLLLIVPLCVVSRHLHRDVYEGYFHEFWILWSRTVRSLQGDCVMLVREAAWSNRRVSLQSMRVCFHWLSCVTCLLLCSSGNLEFSAADTQGFYFEMMEHNVSIQHRADWEGQETRNTSKIKHPVKSRIKHAVLTPDHISLNFINEMAWCAEPEVIRSWGLQSLWVHMIH